MPSEGFVYFIRAAGAVKVGWAKDPEQRLRELQTGNPDRMVLLRVIPAEKTLEGDLHQYYAPWRLNGEWFALLGLLPDIWSRTAWPPRYSRLKRFKKRKKPVPHIGIDPLHHAP